MTSLYNKGQEDVYISGNPSSSFFRSVFKSGDSKYSYVLKELPIDNEIIIFPKEVGDFVKNIYLKVVIEKRNFSFLSQPFSFYKLIEFAELYIGSQLIQVLSGEFMYNYIYINYGTNEIESLEKNTIIQPENYDENIFLFVPIPFYFSNEISKALPIHALHKSHVYVKLRLFSPNPIYDSINILTKTLVLYMINTETRDKPTDLMYAVTQVQSLSLNTVDASEHVENIELKFLNPVRELFICVYEKTNLNIMKYNFSYFKNFYEENNWTTYGSHIDFIELLLNGNHLINHDALMFSTILPTTYYNYPIDFIKRRGHVIPLCLNPNNSNNTGTVNMSRIREQLLRLHMRQSEGERSMRIYAVSYNILKISNGIAGLMFTSYDNNSFHLKF